MLPEFTRPRKGRYLNQLTNSIRYSPKSFHGNNLYLREKRQDRFLKVTDMKCAKTKVSKAVRSAQCSVRTNKVKVATMFHTFFLVKGFPLGHLLQCPKDGCKQQVRLCLGQRPANRVFFRLRPKQIWLRVTYATFRLIRQNGLTSLYCRASTEDKCWIEEFPLGGSWDRLVIGRDTAL